MVIFPELLGSATRRSGQGGLVDLDALAARERMFMDDAADDLAPSATNRTKPGAANAPDERAVQAAGVMEQPASLPPRGILEIETGRVEPLATATSKPSPLTRVEDTGVPTDSGTNPTWESDLESLETGKGKIELQRLPPDKPIPVKVAKIDGAAREGDLQLVDDHRVLDLSDRIARKQAGEAPALEFVDGAWRSKVERVQLVDGRDVRIGAADQRLGSSGELVVDPSFERAQNAARVKAPKARKKLMLEEMEVAKQVLGKKPHELSELAKSPSRLPEPVAKLINEYSGEIEFEWTINAVRQTGARHLTYRTLPDGKQTLLYPDVKKGSMRADVGLSNHRRSRSLTRWYQSELLPFWKSLGLARQVKLKDGTKQWFMYDEGLGWWLPEQAIDMGHLQGAVHLYQDLLDEMTGMARRGASDAQLAEFYARRSQEIVADVANLRPELAARNQDKGRRDGAGYGQIGGKVTVPLTDVERTMAGNTSVSGGDLGTSPFTYAENAKRAAEQLPPLQATKIKKRMRPKDIEGRDLEVRGREHATRADIRTSMNRNRSMSEERKQELINMSGPNPTWMRSGG